MNDTEIVQAYLNISSALTAPGAPFEVCEAEIFGASARIYRHAPANTHEILEEAEAKFADRDLICADGRNMTFREVFTSGRRLAGHMQRALGVQTGDHVGLAMRNRLEWFVAFAALTRLGAVAVLLNSRDNGEQMAHAANAVECSIVIADLDRAERLAAAGFSGRVLIVDDPADGFGALIAEGVSEAAAAIPDADAPAAILFTSGTTGRPKGAVLTQRNLCNLAMNLRFMAAVNLAMAAQSAAGGVETRSGTRPGASLMAFPMFHISGVTTFFGALLTGGSLHFMRRWNPQAAVDLIEQHQVSAVTGPPLILVDLLAQPEAARRLSSLGSVVVGGQATPGSLVENVAALLPEATQAASWGMTELCGAVSSARDPLYRAAPNSCGFPLPIAEIEVRDEQGRTLAGGETGDLWVRSGLAMRGYWNAPEANAAVFDERRWYGTGDVGYVDSAGFVHVVDRRKDMVISGGENIYCAEVERVLTTDNDFIEVSLFGVPDARLGERAVAAITLRPGAERTAAGVQAFVRERLADYKVPAAVVFDLGPFPRNVTGKVDKAALRRRYLEAPGSAP